MSTKQSIQIGGSADHATVINAGTLNYKAAGKSKRLTSYPVGCIGANLPQRNYVKYLVERYHHFRRADSGFGRVTPFNYAVIYKNIENEFKAPVYFIPENRFEALVDYLHERISRTILGKRNHAHGIRNYQTFDEYQLEQEGP